MKSKHDQILETLLHQPRRTINELAEAVGINPISVRHHLTNLQVEGLVTAEEERHGVGRPRLVYYLTEDGMEKFPTRYLRLTTRLLTQMKETMPAQVVSKLFETDRRRHGQRLFRPGTRTRYGRPPRLCQNHAGGRRLSVEWEKKGEQYHIHEISCPLLPDRNQPSRGLHGRPDTDIPMC